MAIGGQASGSISTFSSPIPTPYPRATVYGWSEPPLAPTNDPNSTPSQRRSARPGPHSPLPTPTPIPDFMPPQTTLHINGIQTTAHWYRSPVSVTFAITDNFYAGVTEYQLDQTSDWTYREYDYPPVLLQAEGVHTLTYRSIDKAHNTEAPQTTQIRIDRTPPQAAVLAVDGNQLLNGWYNTPVQVTFGGSDALSGLAGFAQQTTAATWVDSPALTTLATTGDHTLTWRAVDNAGNVSAAQQTTVQVDVTPPTTTVTLDALPVNGWYTRPVTVTLTAVDVGAGVFQTQYRLNGEPGWRSYSGPFPVNATGSQTVVYRSTDRALNTEIAHTLTLPLDLTAPTLDVAASHPPASGIWYSTLMTLTAQASDAQAGVAGIEYELDNSGWQPYTAPLPMATGVLHTVRFRATDLVGHATTSPPLALGIDTQPPTTTVQLSALPTAAGWFGAPVTVTLASTDTQTGVLQTNYRLNNAAWQPYTQPFVISQPSTQTLAYYALDQALNAAIIHTLTLPIDLAAPLLSASVSPSQTSHSWYREAVSVTLQAQDAQAGLASVQYQLDGSSWQPYTSRADRAAGRSAYRPVPRPGPRRPRRQHRPADAGCRWSAPHDDAAAQSSAQCRRLAQSTSHAHPGRHRHRHRCLSDPISVATANVTRHLSAAIAPCAGGPAHADLFSVDRALNQEPPHTHTLQLDLTPPGITYTISGQMVAPGWYQTAATVSVTATDALAEVAGVAANLDGGGWQPYTGPLTITSGGQHTLQFQAHDHAGNRRLLTSPPFGIDTMPLLSTVWLDGGRAANGWYVTPVTVTLTTTDTGAGVAALQWRLNGGLWQSYAGPFVVTSERVNLLEYAALDKAGNQEAQKFTVFSLDLQNPATQAVVVQGRSGSQGWYVSPVTLLLSGQDQGSGLSHVEYQLDQQPWQTAAGPIALNSEGVHQVAYRARDASGRVDATHTLTVMIDWTPPQIQTTLPRAVPYGDIALSGLYTVTDTVSQIVTLTVRLNDEPYLPAQPLRLGENSVAISAINGAGLQARQIQPIFVRGAQVYLPLINNQ